MTSFFGSFLRPFFYPLFWGYQKMVKKWPKNPKFGHFLRKNAKFRFFPYFSPFKFCHFCVSASPPRQKFLGGSCFWTSKMALFWAIFWPKTAPNLQDLGPPQKMVKNGHFWVIFGGSQNPKKWGPKKWSFFGHFLTNFWQKGGMKNREKRVILKRKILKKFYNFFVKIFCKKIFY